MPPIRFLAIIFLAFAAAAPATQPVDAFRQALSAREWNFPRDHGRHDGFKLEWWYFTGNLRDASGRRFGYQLTFFRSAFKPARAPRQSPWAMNDIYFAHAAISDVDGKTFLFKDRAQRDRPGLASGSDQTMDVSLLDWSAKLVDGKIHLRAPEDHFAIDLTCDTDRPPVLEGPGGLNTKGRRPGQASYYYSMVRLRTTGTLRVKNQTFTVEGLSWMDHEFSSNAMAADQVGWDWMGLQLDDGSDLMIYRMRNADGKTDYLSGTRIAPDGRPTYLSENQITLNGDFPWKSPTSGGDYPQHWTLAIAGQPPMVVTSQMPGQELVTTASTKVTYFEGAADVSDIRGKSVGLGYLEMTGYAK